MGSCDAVRSELETGGYTHVFVGSANTIDITVTEYAGVLDDRYAPLTSDGTLLREQSLYRVQRDEQGAISLHYVATVPDELM